MDITTVFSQVDFAELKRNVDSFNKSLDAGKAARNSLDKNDFLKLLITQLSHQDPTQPMEDKEFIAQMAQFSTLEQINNMSEGLSKVASLLARSQAVSLLGRLVEIASGEQTVSGFVEEVSGGDYPQILVNGMYYDYTLVQRVKNE